MMTAPNDLLSELAAAEARVEGLKRAIANGPCRQYGHTWKHIGGRNAGCPDPDCSCSIPVHDCTKCGDCDYGENREADETRLECAKERGVA